MSPRSTRGVVCLSLFLIITGCSVIKDAPKATNDAILELTDWKSKAALKKGNQEYPAVKAKVDSWIDGMTGQIELAATSWTSQVDIARDTTLRDSVNRFLGTAPAGIVDDGIKGVLDWLSEQYKKGRKEEADATIKLLKERKWPN